MPTKRKAADVIGELEQELEEIENRHGQALAGVADCQRRLDELQSRRAELSAAAFFGDAVAAEEVGAVDAESANLVRAASLARSAGESLEADILAVAERLAAERVAASKDEVARLRRERQGVHEQALGHADGLLEALARDKELHGEMVQAALGVNPRTLENISQDHDAAGLHRALAGKLRGHAGQWI